MNLFQAYTSIHSVDIIGLSETFLGSDIQLDHPDLLMKDYALARNNHGINVKRGRVCICYKSCLSSSVLKIPRLNEGLILEIKLKEKSEIFSTLYRPPSQSTDEFDNFLSKFKDNLFSIISKKPFLTCSLADFNGKSSGWCVNDKSFPEGLQIEPLTSYYGLT